MGILILLAILVVVYFVIVKALNFLVDYIFRNKDDYKL